MYNWTNDLPEGTMKTFHKALDHVKLNQKDKRIRILEVGVFAGTSLVSMLKYIPNSVAVALDNWFLSEHELERCNNVMSMDEKYTNEKVKEEYINNLIKEGVDRRVVTLENDSTRALRHLLRYGYKKFDFIYVDGSHETIDTMADLVIAWELLESNGVFVIDDYGWIGYTDTQKPRLAIDIFLDKYSEEYTILDIGYRVFLIKK
ncbi:class I SAM-dependent methyltransferase [Pirellulaceae bacterium]|nr:class I SAM-dependent methyltransferase [Pirellulaceae bacterium]